MRQAETEDYLNTSAAVLWIQIDHHFVLSASSLRTLLKHGLIKSLQKERRNFLAEDLNEISSIKPFVS